MRWFGQAFLFGFLVSSSAAIAEIRHVGESGTKLIDGPGKIYRQVAWLRAGTKLNVVERYQGYALVQTGFGTAWVLDKSLTRNAPKAKRVTVDPYPSVVWTKGGPLNMRSGPGTGHGVTGQCQRGDFVEVVAKAGQWSEVRLANGENGWVYSAYLTR